MEGGQAQVDACGRGVQPQVDVPKKNYKLVSTDVILSSSHAKKLASFLPEFRLCTEKVDIFLRYKLVIRPGSDFSVPIRPHLVQK